MRPPLYRRQLESDLDAWIAEGLVPAESRAAILARASSPSGFGVTHVLALLGAVMLALGALAFVAANWQGLAKLPRLIIVFGAFWTATGLAAWCAARGRTAFAEAALLASAGIFGAGLWFVAQTYHIGGEPTGFFLMWTLGALALALAGSTQSVLTAAMLLAVAWMISALDGGGAMLWQAPVLLGGAALFSARWRWPVALQAVMAAGATFLALAPYEVLQLSGESTSLAPAVATCLGFAGFAALGFYKTANEARSAEIWCLVLAIIALAMFAGMRLDEGAPASWVMIGAALGAGVLCFASLAVRPALDALAPLGGVIAAALAVRAGGGWVIEIPLLAVTGALIVWVISLGLRRQARGVVNWGFAGFFAWTAYLYASVFDGFLDAAAFFVTGGALLLIAALLIDRVRRAFLAEAQP